MSLSENWVMKDGRTSFPQANMLEQKILSVLPFAEQKATVNNAIVFAALGHKDQQRNTGEPQIMHPLRAMQFVVETMPEYPHIVPLLQVIAMHDLIEDTETTKEDIGHLFDDDVVEAVDILSKKRNHVLKEQYLGGGVRYFEDLNNLPETLSHLVRQLVVYAKVADRLENNSTLATLVPLEIAILDPEAARDKQKKYIAETRDYIIPLLPEGDPLRVKLEEETNRQEALLGLAA